MPGPSPIDDVKNAQPAAVSLGDTVTQVLEDILVPPLAAAHQRHKSVAAYLKDITSAHTVLGSIIELGAQLLTELMTVLAGGRKDSAEACAVLAETTLSEFLGADIHIPRFSGRKDTNVAAQAAASIGKALYDRLGSEFGVPASGTVGPGEKAAQLFSGYAVNFSVQNSVIGILADMLSLHELDQVRDIGEDVARSLGLGRLQRLAMGTLLTQAIQKPYTRELATKMRPDRIGVTEVIHAMNAGIIDATTMTNRLAELGYPDEDIKLAAHFNSGTNSASDIVTLLRFGELTEDAAVQLLRDNGWDAAHATNALHAILDTRADNEIDAYIAKLAALLNAKQIDEPTFDSLTQSLPRTPAELGWKKATAMLQWKYPTKQLTWTEIVTAFENGIIDVDYVQSWLDQEGYGPEEQIVKFYLLAIKESAFADKAAAAAAKAAKVAATTTTTVTTPPPAPAT